MSDQDKEPEIVVKPGKIVELTPEELARAKLDWEAHDLATWEYELGDDG